MKKVRCAVYTRKSSEEGLEQDFNSLHAQREACAAYILSQASEGWSLLPEEYDDGGVSGGTLERPALQRLLTDINAGKIDIVVVYKVDRLTRSLLDFAKLVETMDTAEVSFVSVTQSFNTTTSMGRLTLNMLLSFAQFEREVTAERIRDKIAASKAKGMWMGGIPPLGYRPDGRSLAIVEEHAPIIRDIYRRYREDGNVRLVAGVLRNEKISAPRRTTAKGKSFGGGPFSRGQLYTILKNPIYAGNIPHKGKVFPGNHEAIIPTDEWEAVQQQLADNTTGQRRAREQSRALLAGLLFDEGGKPLRPVTANKGSRRYRYYIDNSEPTANEDERGATLRVPAPEIEQLVRKELRALFSDPFALASQAGLALAPAALDQVQNAGRDRADELERGGSATVRQVVDKVTVYPDRVCLRLSVSGLAEMFGLSDSSEGTNALTHEIPVSLKRSGLAVRLIQESGAQAIQQHDPALARLLLQARRWWSELATGVIDIASLSRSEGVTASWMTRVIRLAFLSPQVVDAILAGRVRAEVDQKMLLSAGTISANWNEQRERLLPQVA